MATLGSCLLSNEPAGIGEAMIEARAQGKSWKQIAEDFDLPNPGAARKAFTKHTGLTDYKTKGPAIKQAFKDMVEGGKAASGSITSEGIKAVDDALSSKPAFQVVKEEMTNVKGLTNQQLIDKTGLTNDQLVKIVNSFESKQGYVAIQSQTGATFQQIDEVVWNHLVKKHEGKLWEAYLEKPTSENGFNAVKQRVFELRNKGLDVKDIIANPTSPPESVVRAILDNKWTMPPQGSLTPVIPPPPPQVYEGPLPSQASGRNFTRPSKAEMDKWNNSLGMDLNAGQKAAVQSYTGSGYSEINTFLRNGNSYGTSTTTMTNKVRKIDQAMRPLPMDVTVTRNVSGTHVFGNHPMEQLVGTVFRDQGYLSTTITESGVFGGNVQIIINVPTGAKARWVQPISRHPGEMELLLARDTKMVVTRVEVSEVYQSKRYIVHAEVIV